MKHWISRYTVKYVNGTIKEYEVTIEETNITRALATVINEIVNPKRLDPEISQIVVWDVGIVEDDVF